jgi:glutathione S-transferase
MKLYYYPGACSLAPHIAMREAGLEFELEKVSLSTGKTESGGDFKTVNPKGYVPALELDDGQVLTEVAAIVQCLADKAPAAKLAPANGTFDRYRLQEWLNFISSEVHKQFTPFFSGRADDNEKKAAMQMIHLRFDYVTKHLEKSDYLLGEQFSVADAYLYTVTTWAPLIKLDLSPWPAIQKYQARIAERPSVKKAMKAEGLVEKG